jgi:hypothetical protein
MAAVTGLFLILSFSYAKELRCDENAFFSMAEACLPGTPCCSLLSLVFPGCGDAYSANIDFGQSHCRGPRTDSRRYSAGH